MKATWKDFPLEMLNGALDTRSPSGTIDFATWRILLNIDGSEAMGICRGWGFRKYLWDQDCYINQDLHDQLVLGQSYNLGYTVSQPASRDYIDYAGLPIYRETPEQVFEYCGTEGYVLGRTCKEAITMLHTITTPLRTRRLLAGTKSRLYVADESGGNWRILADGLGGPCQTATDCGCSPIRLSAATMGVTTVLANGVDFVLAWDVEDGPDGCSNWSAEYIQDLLELNIDSAEIVQEWGGFVFLASIRADGEPLPGRLLWSDFGDARSWFPGGQSLAGFHDFGAGERILVVAPIGGRLRVYTSQAIYDLTKSANEDLVFNVQEIYRGPNLPIFRWSLVNTGDAHFYMGPETVFVMSEWDREPTAFEWIHRACGIIYKGVPASWVSGFNHFSAVAPINRSACDVAVGGYDPVRRVVWFSWAAGNSTCPSMSIVLWPLRRKASVVDHGFTAFVAHQPGVVPTMRDWMADIGLCDPQEGLVVKQGAPCAADFEPVEFDGLWNPTEDFDAPRSDGSVAAVICDLCLEDICQNCETDVRFLAVSAVDKAIKEIGPFYFREMVDVDPGAEWPDASVATYRQDGYTSLIQGDAYRYRVDSNKRFRALAVNFNADDQTVPSTLYAAAGYGMQPDRLQWEVADPITLGAIDPGVIADDLRPGEVPSFQFFATGSFLSYRIWTTGTGGQFCIASLTAKVQSINNCW